MAKINSINNKSSSLTIDPGASGDSFVQLDINTSGKFCIGVDDTDDSFRISQGSALGTNDTFIMTAAGERTMPLQPAFLAVITSDKTNVTGDSTQYTVVYDSEIFDQNADFDGTSTFTAPVTGKYLLTFTVKSEDLSGSFTQVFIMIITSNNTYYSGYTSDTARDANDDLSHSFSVVADMDASDTATTAINWAGSTKTVDIGGHATDVYTSFSGALLC